MSNKKEAAAKKCPVNARSVPLLERQFIEDDCAELRIETAAAIAAAAMMVHLGTMNEVFSASNLVI